MKLATARKDERIRMENKALEIENQLLRAIIDNIHEAVCVTNERDEIIVYNRESERIDGLSRKDVLGKKEHEVYGSSDYLFAEEVTNKVRETGKAVIEQLYHYSLPDGKKVSIIFSSFPFYYNNQLTAIYNIFRNMNQISEFIAITLEIQKKLLRKENNTLIGARYLLDDIIGVSDNVKETVSLARKVATHDSPVFIVGETGTGKELFAHGIHNASLYCKGPFIPINCAAIPETLLESMLFGTVKGAFTGAVEIPGLFEQAEDGTIFFDEINSMPYYLQAKLLRVLQDKVVRRIGSKTETPVNCRIISASNVDPLISVRENTIRLDLFFRLAIVTINIPALRERKIDISVLAKHFIDKYNSRFGLFINHIEDEVINLFNDYNWPGNIRELENVIESAMNFADKDDKDFKEGLLPKHFREKLDFTNSMKNYPNITIAKSTLKNALKEFEKHMIEDALRKNSGNITRTAASLGLLRQNLHYRIRRYGIII